ncbi:hypothetical protein DPMN_020313 [Dreissena polymorpha]|uniref:Uncharacterized protein n=1 Tax=Dreissena polymorpha TaxID=45954 RepID=A0A9D4NKU0_DREPO|nr:hypothetical protein DPMN_020313 [Dreissena polymorpha]
MRDTTNTSGNLASALTIKINEEMAYKTITTTKKRVLSNVSKNAGNIPRRECKEGTENHEFRQSTHLNDVDASGKIRHRAVTVKNMAKESTIEQIKCNHSEETEPKYYTD